jgi:hypothetical protein
MSWTIQNNSTASINVTDIPIPQELLPYTSAQFAPSDVLTSRILGENLGNGSLCVTNFGTFGTADGVFYPLTYPLLPMGAISTNGGSAPVTMGVFQEGTLMANVLSVSSGGSLTLAWEDYDGTTYYPVGTVGTIDSAGAQVFALSEYGTAGRLTWMVSGSVQCSLSLQVR